MPVEIDGYSCFSTSEACTYLGVSRETLNNYVTRYKLVKYRKGLTNTKYYRVEQLDRIKADREAEYRDE